MVNEEVINLIIFIMAFGLLTCTQSFDFPSPRSITISDLVSSPERYAESLGLSVDELKNTQSLKLRASNELHEKLQDENLNGKEKHILQCEHRFKNGRHPFVCPTCWSYIPICVCSDGPSKYDLPDGIELIVWCHHREWGLTSNTGSLLGVAFQNTKLLMKGLPAHDAYLDEVLTNPMNNPVILWPREEGDRGISLDEIRCLLTRQEVMRTGADAGPSQPTSLDTPNKPKAAKVTLIAIDGTWRNSRRMVARLPPSIPMFSLSEDQLFGKTEPSLGATTTNKRSLLAPLRKQKDGLASSACTLEAVVGTLRLLGCSESACTHALNLGKRKVELTCRYRGKILDPSSIS